MSDNKSTSFRKLGKALGVSHSTLVKIANGTYGANPGNIFKKVISHIQGVVIPEDKYDKVLEMLNDAKFDQFGETSRTAAWLYEQIEHAKIKLEGK